MENFKADSNKEIIITTNNLLNLIEGLSFITSDLEKVGHKLDEEENRGLMIKMVAMLISIVKLFPKEDKEQMFGMIKEDLGIDVNEMFKKISDD